MGGFAHGAKLGVLDRVKPDQIAREADLIHHLVTGIDAKPAANAFHLQAITNINSGRADIDTGMTINAVPGFGDFTAHKVFAFDRAARFTAPVFVGDDQAFIIKHRRLEPWPRAHIGADLLATPSGEKIG